MIRKSFAYLRKKQIGLKICIIIREYQRRFASCLLEIGFILVMKNVRRNRDYKLQAAAQTQRRALDRYVVKGSQFTSQNQTPGANVG
jgi:hypothetical protein